MYVMLSLMTLRSQKLWYWGGLQCNNTYINVVKIGRLTNSGACIKKKHIVCTNWTQESM